MDLLFKNPFYSFNTSFEKYKIIINNEDIKFTVFPSLSNINCILKPIIYVDNYVSSFLDISMFIYIHIYIKNCHIFFTDIAVRITMFMKFV